MEFKEFLHQRTEKSGKETPEEILKKLLLSSLYDFPEEDREYIRDYVERHWLTPEEIKETHEKVKEWWKKQFGGSYDNVTQRRKILYGLKEKKETDLQERYLENIKFRVDDEENKKLKDIFIKEFPDQVQGIELLFGLQEILTLQRRLEIEKKDKTLADIKEDIILVTEYSFTMVNFIQANQADKEFLKIFWQMLDEIAASIGYLKDFQGMKAGILAHVASHQVAEKIGLRPKTSNPTEDALFGIDEYGRRGEVLQYKSKDALSIVRGEVDIERKKPALGIFEYMNGLLFYNDFREKMKKRCVSQNKTKQIYYFIEIPRDAYDAVTGELNKGVLEEVDSKNIQEVETVLAREILIKEGILRNEIVRGTEEYYQNHGRVFNESTMPYLLNDEEYKVLLRQCILQSLGSVNPQSKSILFPFVFHGEEKSGLAQALKDFWGSRYDAPSFDNKEAVEDYLFRRYLRDVDYGWKKRDMAGGTGISTGK